MSKLYKCKCQICDELYAVIDLDEIKYPITGSMFKSIDPAHGVPPPFYDGAEFEFMRCPFGQHRPMIMPNTILCDNGMILNVPDREPPFFTPLGEERQYTLDRDAVMPMPMMDEETAGRIARGLPVTTNDLGIGPRGTVGHMDGDTFVIVDEKNFKLKEKSNGEADTQQGKTESNEPVEEKEVKDESVRDNFCVKCDKQLNTKAGFRNHMRIKHGITNPEDYGKATK